MQTRRFYAGAIVFTATVGFASSCTYDFGEFEGLSPPEEAGSTETGGRAGQAGAAGAGAAGRGGAAGARPDAGDASSDRATGGSGGSSGTGGSGGATGGTAGIGTGGATGGGMDASSDSSGGAGGKAGSGGSGGAAGIAGAGTGGTSGKGGSGGVGGAAGASGSGGTGGTGGPPDSGTTGGASGAVGSGGSGGSAGKSGSGGTAGASSDGGIIDVRDASADNCASLGGVLYAGHCYYPVKTTATFPNARQQACASPAHLVTISSDAEQKAVTSILGSDDYWIGMRRANNSDPVESSYKWITGDALTFTNWDVYSDADKEPNFTGECVRTRSTGKWGDIACSDQLASICELD